MKDLYHAIDALNSIVNESKELLAERDGDGIRNKPNVPSYNSIGDMVKAIKTPGKQGVADPNQSAKNIAAAQPKPAAKPKLGGTGVGRQDGPGLPKPAAPKINPAVPAAGPVRANPINPQAMAATKAAASVVNAPKQAAQAPKPAAVAVPKPKPAAPAPRAKVKATAANTKDFDKTMALQKKLQAQGYDIKADGLMGPNTRAAMAKAAAAKKPATPPSKVTPTAGDPGMQAAPAPQANRAQSQGGRTAQQAASAPQAPPQDAQAARVAKSNAALAGDAEKAKKATSGMIDKITGGISDLFKPSPKSAIGKRQAAAMDEPGDAMAAAVTGSTQSGVSAKPGPSLSDVTAAGNARFGDPLQKARDARDAQQQTSPLQGSGKQIPANIQKKIDARRDDIANRYEPDADGNYSLSNPPRQPSDAAPTTRTAAAPTSRMAQNRLRQQQKLATARQQGAQDSASGRLANAVLPSDAPERGIVPGQGAGERTVSVGGQQVRGAEADRAINVAQAGADNARLRMGAARAGLSVKDYAAQQNRLNKQAGDRMMKTAKASDAGVF